MGHNDKVSLKPPTEGQVGGRDKTSSWKGGDEKVTMREKSLTEECLRTQSGSKMREKQL